MSLVQQSDPEAEAHFTTSPWGAGRKHVSPATPPEAEDAPTGMIRPFPSRSGRAVTEGVPDTGLPWSPDVDPRAGRWPDMSKTECGLHTA